MIRYDQSGQVFVEREVAVHPRVNKRWVDQVTGSHVDVRRRESSPTTGAASLVEMAVKSFLGQQTNLGWDHALLEGIEWSPIGRRIWTTAMERHASPHL